MIVLFSSMNKKIYQKLLVEILRPIFIMLHFVALKQVVSLKTMKLFC